VELAGRHYEPGQRLGDALEGDELLAVGVLAREGADPQIGGHEVGGPHFVKLKDAQNTLR
jgi:hypothetical protein